MAYRLELREGIASGCVRIATEQVDRVVRELSNGEDRTAAVHESRKSLKRLRALLRLARPGLGEATFKTQNARFRDIAASMSADRDRAVLGDVAKVQAAAMGPRWRKTFAAISAHLAAPQAAEQSAPQGDTRQIIARLTAARRDLARLRIEPDDFRTLAHGLELSYRRGRRQLKAAYAQPDDEAFHDLRKAVQQQWRHMQVLQKAWPDMFTARLALARRLSQILGDDHDLAMFVACIQALPRGVVAAADKRAIVGHCRQAQARLRLTAHPMCQQLYAERSGRFARRMAAVWQAAVSLDAIEEAQADRGKRSRAASTRRGNSAQRPAASV